MCAPGRGSGTGQWPEAVAVCTQPSNTAPVLAPAEPGVKAPRVKCRAELALHWGLEIHSP